MDQVIGSADLQEYKEQISKKIEKLPNFLKVLFFVEMWERFSYYGMRALLVIFLTSHLGFEDTKAYAIYSVFAAICYMGPVLGGVLADKLLGFRNMVLIGGTIIALGHGVMLLVELKQDLIYLGLALIAIGTGMFKGNITNLLGSCYNDHDPERNRGFTLFYVGVNLGSFIAAISCGFVAQLYGWNYGFGLAGAGMVIGLITFIKFKYALEDKNLNTRSDIMRKKVLRAKAIYVTFAGCIISAIIISKVIMYSETFGNILALAGTLIFSIFAYIIFKSPAKQRRNLIALSILIAFFMLFFALEMQLGSLINLFTQRNVVSTVLGVQIPATVSQAINPLSIIVIGFILGLYMKFDPKYSTAIFAFGILTIPICFFVLYIGCVNANSEGKVEYWYLLIAIFFMGLGELCIGPLLQEQATLRAPEGLKGLIMGIVMLALAFSNLAGIIIAKFMSIPSINGEVNPLESLAIYQEGFWDIALFNLGLVALFLLFYKFINKVIVNNKQDSVQ
jgi:POT family proton-dependent oligopeptide transporter